MPLLLRMYTKLHNVARVLELEMPGYNTMNGKPGQRKVLQLGLLDIASRHGIDPSTVKSM
jgi:hypothetical protein